jgi:hypothetical protein
MYYDYSHQRPLVTSMSLNLGAEPRSRIPLLELPYIMWQKGFFDEYY